MAPGLAGLPWFNEEDYSKAREVMSDSSRLPATYLAWLRGAETAERDLREQGHHPIRVGIIPEDFLQWCRKRQLPPDEAARRQFVRYVLEEIS